MSAFFYLHLLAPRFIHSTCWRQQHTMTIGIRYMLHPASSTRISSPSWYLRCPFKRLFQSIRTAVSVFCSMWETSSSLFFLCTNVPIWSTYEPGLPLSLLHRWVGSEVLCTRTILACPHLWAFASFPQNCAESLLTSPPCLIEKLAFPLQGCRNHPRNGLRPLPIPQGKSSGRPLRKKSRPQPEKRPTDGKGDLKGITDQQYLLLSHRRTSGKTLHTRPRYSVVNEKRLPTNETGKELQKRGYSDSVLRKRDYSIELAGAESLSKLRTQKPSVAIAL